jgi:hypothetical protein
MNSPVNDANFRKAINDSGFPLQLGLEQLAKRVPGWLVLGAEVAWADGEEDEKFIDLVVKQEGGPIRLVVECKRARDSEWLFLRSPNAYPYHQRDQTINVRCRVMCRPALGVTGTFVDHWMDLPFMPGSPQAEYCVLRKDNQRTQTLLEKTAAEIVRATEAIACQEAAIVDHGRTSAPQLVNQAIARVYVPMIVTTAKLFMCDANYEDID